MLPYGSRLRAVRTFGWNFSHSSSSGPCSDATHLPLTVCHTLITPFISPVAHRSPVALKAMVLTLSYTSARDHGGNLVSGELAPLLRVVVVEEEGAVVLTARQYLAIPAGVERHAQHRVRVLLERLCGRGSAQRTRKESR